MKRHCEQLKCGYYLRGGCQKCEACSTESYEINEECPVCWQCENKEGSIRFGDKGIKVEEIAVAMKR